MAQGAAPSTEQLLDLLKRAAEELKHSQEEARTAILALQKEQAAHAETEAELEAVKGQLKGSAALQSTDEQLLRDQIDAERENSKSLVERVKEVEAELKALTVERDALRQRVADGDTAISVEQQQEEARRQALTTEHANALEALKAEHDEALKALKAEHATALENAQGDAAKQLQAAQAEKAEAEANQKAMLDDAAGKLVQAESQLAQEREKHQSTAQKLLETRAKVRELEAALASEQERVKGLEAAARQLADAHERELKEKTGTLSKSLEQTQAELAKAKETWAQVERQYEALHREMLLTLEQRDDARRQLENERAERERLSRALQGHRS